MITKSKLSDQPENKLTTKFKPIEFEQEDFVDLGGGKGKYKVKHTAKESKNRSRNKLMIIFLPILMVATAAATFGIIYLVAPKKTDIIDMEDPIIDNVDMSGEDIPPEPNPDEEQQVDEFAEATKPITKAQSSNPTIQYGRLMLINPNFPVETSFIKTRKTELISLQSTYGIKEGNPGNGDNLLDKEAAEWLSKMAADYTIFNPGHVLETRSCFREVGTNCGRMCAATGESDHHSGLTCDLLDPVYGTSLDTNAYEKHLEWQWLKQNSYRYGFIDRFPAAWAGGPMSEPANVDAIGSTGLYETWHYRYVGVFAATEIATGVYNDKAYDSLEHYLRMRGLVPDLLNGK